MKNISAVLAMLLLPSATLAAGPPEKIVLRIRDAAGLPVAGASVLALEGTSTYLRQALVRADSNGVAVAEIGKDAYLGLHVIADGYEIWKLELAPGSPDRKRKIIDVRLRRQPKGRAVAAEG